MTINKINKYQLTGKRRALLSTCALRTIINIPLNVMFVLGISAQTIRIKVEQLYAIDAVTKNCL